MLPEERTTAIAAVEEQREDIKGHEPGDGFLKIFLTNSENACPNS